MKTPRKIWKSIAKKFKNSTASKEQKPSISSSTAREEGKKLSEEVLNKEVTIKQQVVTGKSVPAEEEVHEVCDVEHKSVIDTDIKLYNINSEDLQPISESSEEAQIETTVEPTSVDRADSPSPAEPCFDGDAVEEKPSTRQRQAIVAGVVGAALLVGSVVFYTLKIDVTVAVVVGIVGLACIGFALYNIINPNTKLEKVEDIEQPIVESSLNPT